MLEEKAKEFVIEACLFEVSDWTITMRHQSELVWQDIPIGPLTSKADAQAVQHWLLDGGLEVLWKIADNLIKDSNEHSNQTQSSDSPRFE